MEEPLLYFEHASLDTLITTIFPINTQTAQGSRAPHRRPGIRRCSNAGNGNFTEIQQPAAMLIFRGLRPQARAARLTPRGNAGSPLCGVPAQALPSSPLTEQSRMH